jgi:hypothetical protein
MAKFTVSIDTGNAAFDPVGSEVARILRELARAVDGADYFNKGERHALRDINGNNVGEWKFGR